MYEQSDKSMTDRGMDHEVRGSRHKEPAVLGEAFLNATNHWLLHPDSDPEANLSIEGRMYLDEIKWVMNKAKDALVATDGQIPEPIIVISDMPLDEYLEAIKSKIIYPQEFSYIESVARRMEDLIKIIHQELLTKGTQSTPSLLELLEQRQRGRTFSPPKQTPPKQ